MAQTFLHHPRVYAGPQQLSGMKMPQPVERRVGRSGLLRSACERARKTVWAQPLAFRIAEDVICWSYRPAHECCRGARLCEALPENLH